MLKVKTMNWENKFKELYPAEFKHYQAILNAEAKPRTDDDVNKIEIKELKKMNIIEDVDEYDFKIEIKTIGNRTYVKAWYTNGRKSYEEEYKNEKLEGKYIEWYENGNKMHEGEYKNGKEEGKWIGWWENGNKLYEGEYKNGEQEGKWLGWYENGDKWYEKEFKNGKVEGKLIG